MLEKLQALIPNKTLNVNLKLIYVEITLRRRSTQYQC